MPSEDQRARWGHFIALLEQPDPPELAGRRGHRVTVEGRADRVEALATDYGVRAMQLAVQGRYVDRDSWPVAP
jgi:hypothetical protein